MSTSTLQSPVDAIESKIAVDMVRRGLPFLPLLLILSMLVWGKEGAISSAVAIGVVLANFLFAAAMLSWASRISVGAVMGAALFGYLLRLALIALVVLPLRSQSWFRAWPLGITLIVTHLGLLLWELRHISLSFTAPGLKPRRTNSPANSSASSTRSEA